MPVSPEAFFLPATSHAGGQRFCLYHPVQGASPRGLVLYIHPFAEEMNKARRMAALQSRALAQAGFAVLQIDLHGCGDSSGDFGDATWQSWVDDVLQGCHWLRARHGNDGNPGDLPLWLWGLRAGCLLAADAARQLGEPCNFLFWQPPAAGKPLLQQFLRLKAAGDLMGGQAKGVMQALRQQLADGAPVEIAGYLVAPGLAAELEQATLAPSGPTVQAQRVEWFELSTREDANLSPVSLQTMGQWQQTGFDVASHMVLGPAFWQTTEIEDAPALIAETLSAVTMTPQSHPQSK
jgi:uncharacterized protein